MKVFGIIISVLLLAYIVVGRVGTEPQSERDIIEKGIDQARKQGELSSERESLLRVQLSLLDFIAQNNQPPDSLSQLVPTYFSAVPVNPLTKKPYEYQRLGSSFKLGQQVTAPTPTPTQVASADAKQTEAQSDSEIEAIIETINPNTIEIEEFVYDPEGKRDPFMPFDETPDQRDDSELTPLERYSLGQLRLAAVLKDASGEPTAMIEDSTGKGYPVRVGTKIGPDNGEIASIERDRVKIVQTKVNLAGETIQSVVELKLTAQAVGPDTSRRRRGR